MLRPEDPADKVKQSASASIVGADSRTFQGSSGYSMAEAMKIYLSMRRELRSRTLTGGSSRPYRVGGGSLVPIRRCQPKSRRAFMKALVVPMSDTARSAGLRTDG